MKNFSDSAIMKTRGYKMNDFNRGYYTGYENAMNDMKAYITKQLINNSKAEKENYSPSWSSYDDQGNAVGIQGFMGLMNSCDCCNPNQYNTQQLGPIQGATGIPYNYGYMGNGPTGPIGYMP